MSLYFLSLILVSSIFVGCSTSNMFLAICMLELSMYTFLYMNYEHKFLGTIAGCIKYFFIQSVGSIFLFLGCVMMYLSLTNVLMHTLFLLGFLLKLGAFPFYFWVIPVSSTLPYLMIGVFSSPMKILPVAMVVQYFNLYMINIWYYENLMLFCGVLSMVVGMFLGLSSGTLRKMLGASSVTHTGWLLMTLPISFTWQYFLYYSLAILILFSSFTTYCHIVSSISLLSLGGFPPFGVFCAKLWVIMKLVDSSISVVIPVIVLITSVISLFYYMKYSFVFFTLSRTSLAMPWLLGVLFMSNLFAGCAFIVFFYSQVAAAAF